MGKHQGGWRYRLRSDRGYEDRTVAHWTVGDWILDAECGFRPFNGFGDTLTGKRAAHANKCNKCMAKLRQRGEATPRKPRKKVK